MTFAEQMEARGIQKGKQEGIQQGKKEGKIEGEIRLLKKLIKLKFPDAKAVPLASLSLDQLEIIGQRILTCDTLEEVLEGIVTV